MTCPVSDELYELREELRAEVARRKHAEGVIGRHLAALEAAKAEVLMFAEANADLVARENNLHQRLDEEIDRVTRTEAKIAQVLNPPFGFCENFLGEQYVTVTELHSVLGHES